MAYILMAEDNIDDVDLFLRELDKINLRTRLVVAQSVDAAIGHIQTELPSLVILDLRLEGARDGLDILRYMRSNSKAEKLPVIVLSASREQQKRIDTFNLGVNVYLKKPILYNQLADAIFFLKMPWELGAPDV